MIVIDAHSHLWLRQDTIVEGHHIAPLPNGRAVFFGEERQMLPPFLIDGTNSAEVFISNMNYAGVGGAVVVQEVIDGSQNDYLAQVSRRYPERFFCCGLPYLGLEKPGGSVSSDRFLEEVRGLCDAGFRGIAIPGHRVHQSLEDFEAAFKLMESRGVVLSMCLDDNERQIGQMRELASSCPDLKVAIGHFGMATGRHWLEQIRLALAPNVFIESGGITWLYNSEFYPYSGAVEAIRRAADEVGIEKLMWGSDYPRTICAITYRMSFDFILKSDRLTPEEKDAFLGTNAVKFYGFHNLPELPYIKNMSE